MNAQSIPIPFESQHGMQTGRGCGAAALSMVYRSFGRNLPAEAIWPSIAKPNRLGLNSSTTHLMARHAIGLGLSAVIVQARHPLQALRLAREAGIRVILNHRAHPFSSGGHYTVLADIDDRSVLVHDPSLGPSRRMAHAELLQLWQPQFEDSEIAGNVLIAVAAEPLVAPACEFCHTSIPAAVQCPRCSKPVSLRPAAVLGCVRDGCIARLWNSIACPECDFVFHERTKAAAQAPRPATPPCPARLAPPDLSKLFAQLDGFCARVLSIPEAAAHADVLAQFEFLRASREKLRMAQAEEIAAINANLDRLTAAAEASSKRREAQRKADEERHKPLPPLDPNQLAEALLTGLGFRRA